MHQNQSNTEIEEDNYTQTPFSSQYKRKQYRKSSIKPPRGLFFLSTFEGGLKREGGGGAYLI